MSLTTLHRDVPVVLEELARLRAEVSALQAHALQSDESKSPLNNASPDISVQERSHCQSLPVLTEVPKADPLYQIPPSEARRLLEFYADHLQCIYYLADMDTMRATTAALYGHTDVPRRLPGGLDEGDAAHLRIVLANAMLIDSDKHGNLPSRLYSSVQHHFPALHSAERLDIKALSLMVLIVSSDHIDCVTRLRGSET